MYLFVKYLNNVGIDLKRLSDMNANAKYFCHIWYKQASANRCEKFTGNLKSYLWRSSNVVNFNFFIGTFKGFCQNIPEVLLRESHLSVTIAWNILIFVRSS